jgi:5'-nucleotidase
VLANVASHFGQVLIMAPDGEQSAMSHAVKIQRPLRYHPIKIGKFEVYRVNGTPADCVALGLYHWGGADLILSGINLGSNLGHDIWHSGTVASGPLRSRTSRDINAPCDSTVRAGQSRLENHWTKTLRVSA